MGWAACSGESMLQLTRVGWKLSPDCIVVVVSETAMVLQRFVEQNILPCSVSSLNRVLQRFVEQNILANSCLRVIGRSVQMVRTCFSKFKLVNGSRSMRVVRAALPKFWLVNGQDDPKMSLNRYFQQPPRKTMWLAAPRSIRGSTGLMVSKPSSR